MVSGCCECEPTADPPSFLVSFLPPPNNREREREREALEFARKLFFCCGAAAAPIGAMVATEVKGHGIRQQSPVGRSVPPTMLLIMPAPGENLRERGGCGVDGRKAPGSL